METYESLKLLQRLVKIGVMETRGEGADLQLRFTKDFENHVVKYATLHPTDSVTLWTWFEVLKSFNRDCQGLSFDESIFIKRMFEEMLDAVESN